MPLTLADQRPPVAVVNSSGVRTPFVAERFAAGILRNVAPQHVTNVLNAADVVNGVLTGSLASDPSASVSTDQLRAAHSVILANPAQPDIPTLARILAPNTPLQRAGISDELQLQRFYEAVATAAGAALVPQARFSLLSTAEQFSNGSLVVQQRLVKVIAPSGVMTDVAAGAANQSHALGSALAFEAVTVTGLSVDSVAKARAIFTGAHTLFSPTLAGNNGLLTRAFYLSNLPDVAAFHSGALQYVPTWTAFATTPAITVIAMMHATTGDIQFLTVFPTAALALQASFLLLASWGGFFHGVAKVIGIVALGIAIGGETIGGLASSPTIVGPLAAAVLIMLTLLAMIKLFVDLLMQILGESEQDKLQKLLDRIKGLIDKANKIDPKDPNAKDQLKGILDEAKAGIDEAKALGGGSAADDAAHAIEGALGAADGALAK